MPDVLTRWQIRIDQDAAIRGQGADPDELRRRHPRIAEASAAAICEAERLLCPTVLFRDLRIVAYSDTFLDLETGRFGCGSWVARRLARARALVALVCTIGPALENRVSAVFSSDSAYALALSGAGTAAVEMLAAGALERFKQRAAERSLYGAVECWPGSPQWPAEQAQPQIFDLVDPRREAEDTVRLLPSQLMRPVKSLSLLIGLVEQPVDCKSGCSACAVRVTCRYRPDAFQATRPAPSSAS